MARLTDDELAQLAAYHVTAPLSGLAMARELIERRSHDREIARLVNVIRGFMERNSRFPHDTTLDLLDLLDRMGEEREP